MIGIIILSLILAFASGFMLDLFIGISCKHNWKLVEGGDIVNSNTKAHVGWIKVYECEHCKKMKREQVTVNTTK